MGGREHFVWPPQQSVHWRSWYSMVCALPISCAVHHSSLSNPGTRIFFFICQNFVDVFKYVIDTPQPSLSSPRSTVRASSLSQSASRAHVMPAPSRKGRHHYGHQRLLLVPSFYFMDLFDRSSAYLAPFVVSLSRAPRINSTCPSLNCISPLPLLQVVLSLILPCLV